MEPTIGAQELALLQDIEAHAPATVGDVFARYGRANALARTTVLTMMERLRAKGYLTRVADGHLFRYDVSRPVAQARRDTIAAFVDRTLGGSVAPLCAFMAERGSLSAEERATLEALLRTLDDEREERP